MAVRETSDANTVIPRVARMLSIPVERADGGWVITVPGDPLGPTFRKKWRALAFLTDLAIANGMDLSRAAYGGTPPTKGLSAWEEDALWALSSKSRPTARR